MQAKWKPSAIMRSAEDHRLLLTAVAIDLVDNFSDLLLAQQMVDEAKRHHRVTRQFFSQEHTARVVSTRTVIRFIVFIDRFVARLDLGVQRHGLGLQRVLDFSNAAEHHAFALLAVTVHGAVVQTENHVLGRHDDRLAVGRAEDVVGSRHHQHARFELCFED